MSDKLTEQKIEEMIAELLQEKTIDVEVKGIRKPADKQLAVQSLGLPKNRHTGKTWTYLGKLAGKEIDKKNIDDPDFEAALKQGNSAHAHRAAIDIFMNTTDRNIYDFIKNVVNTKLDNKQKKVVHKQVSDSRGDFAKIAFGREDLNAAKTAQNAAAAQKIKDDLSWLKAQKYPAWTQSDFSMSGDDVPVYIQDFHKNFDNNPIKYIMSYVDLQKPTNLGQELANFNTSGILQTRVFDGFFKSKVPNKTAGDVLESILTGVKTNGKYDIDKIKLIRNIDQYNNLVVPNLEVLKKQHNKATQQDRLGAVPDLDILEKAIGTKTYVDTNGKAQSLKAAFLKIVFNNNDNLVNRIKKLKETKSELEPQDFDEFFDLAIDKKDGFTPQQAVDIEKNLKKFYALIPNNELDLKNLTSAVIKQYRQTDTIRTSKGTLSGYNITSRSASGAKIDAQVLDSFAKAFDGTTFKDRLKQFNNYSNEVSKFIQSGGAIASGESMDQKFAKFITFDLMQQILYSFEASSAGWVYESFLAFMAHGSAIGASYGAGDFTINQGGNKIEGSAKLLQTDKSEQNIENLNTGDTIRYVVGVKKSIAPIKMQASVTAPVNQPGKKIKTPQTLGAAELTVYVFDIKKTGANEIRADQVNSVSDASQKLILKEKNTRVDIEIPNSVKPLGVIDLIFLQGEEFEEYSGLIVRDISEQLEKTMLYMSELKSNIDDYVLNSSDQDEKNYYSKEAMKNHSQLKIALQGPSGTSGLFTESKLQSLDNLIAEAMRDIRKKRK